MPPRGMVVLQVIPGLAAHHEKAQQGRADVLNARRGPPQDETLGCRLSVRHCTVALMSPQEDMMAAVPFAELERKSGDLYVIQVPNGTLYIAEAIEKVGNHYRAYFRFMENNIPFDSSVNCTVAEIKQVIRNGIAIWFNRG